MRLHDLDNLSGTHGLHLAEFCRLSRQVLPVPLLATGSVGADVLPASPAPLTDRTRARVPGGSLSGVVVVPTDQPW
jgi:hypothetical protein